MEIIKLGLKSYYIKDINNIGVYLYDKDSVYLIDSGNDKDKGKKILKIIKENGWNVAGIINTHSHADHIGGNKIIQDREQSVILSHGIERAFIENPILEPTILYGSKPIKALNNKFLLADSSHSIEIEDNLPNNLEYIELKGHTFDMVGIKTDDNVYYLGDCLVGKNTIDKYHIFFIQDIKEYLKTLDFLKTLKGKYYVLSHVELTDDLTELIELNKNKINEICDKICSFSQIEHSFEEILKFIFDEYNLKMDETQYVLVGSTIKSYLTYLLEENRINYKFKNNKMYWSTIDNS